jgi:hypothetical protein
MSVEFDEGGIPQNLRYQTPRTNGGISGWVMRTFHMSQKVANVLLLLVVAVAICLAVYFFNLASNPVRKPIHRVHTTTAEAARLFAAASFE